MSKVFVSLTCIPTRINNILLVLQSISEQTRQPDYIIIHYPKKCIRLNLEYDVENLKTIIKNTNLYDKIIINECSDYGPITKLYPLINMTNIKQDDMIIVIDDDNYYNKYLFEYLITDFERYNKEICVGVSGLLYPRKLGSWYQCIANGYGAELLEAAFGYIIGRSFLRNDLHNWVLHNITSMEDVEKNNWINAFFSDDYVIARYMDIHGIQKKVLDDNSFIVKDTCFVEGKGCHSNNSLSGLEHNLDKYVKSEFELKQKQ